MLKSRLLAGGAFLVALCAVLPIGNAVLQGGSTAPIADQHSTKTVEVSDLTTEYAVSLSCPADAVTADLNYSHSYQTVSLQHAASDFEDVSSPSISIDDPTVQRSFEEAEAKQEEAEKMQLSDGVDGFVFDISKTIFPVTEEEVEMLKYVVEAEGGTGSLEDKRLVTFSITNRVLSDNFPDTLYEVLHSVNQFSTIENYYSKKKVPSPSTSRAVEEVLMGACTDNSQNALYFYCTNYPVADWIVDWFENDLVYLYTVGCDRFFTDPS